MENKKLIFTLLLLGVLITEVVYAQITVPTSFERTLKNLINLIVTGVAILVAITMILAAVTYVTSGGDPAAIERAKNMFVYAIIGLGVAIVSWAFINWILGRFGAGKLPS